MIFMTLIHTTVMLSFIYRILPCRFDFLPQKRPRQLFCGHNLWNRTFNCKFLSESVNIVKYHERNKPQRNRYKTNSLLHRGTKFKPITNVLFANGKKRNVQFLECLKPTFCVIEYDTGDNKTSKIDQNQIVFDDIKDAAIHSRLVERFQGAGVLLINNNCIFRKTYKYDIVIRDEKLNFTMYRLSIFLKTSKSPR